MTRKKKYRTKPILNNDVSLTLDTISANSDSKGKDHSIKSSMDNLMTSTDQTLPPIASKAMFWRPRYLDKSQWLQQIPFYFWLIEVLQPKIVVDPNVNSGVGYFAICQAIDKLNQDGLVYGALGHECNIDKVTAYNHEHYREFSSFTIEKEKKFINSFAEHSIDLLLLKNDSLILSGKNELTSLSQRMSSNGIVLIHGSLMNTLREQSQFIKSRYLTFELNQAPGLLLLCFGSQIPPRLEALIKQSQALSGQRLIQNIYARLGSASEDAWHRLVHERKLKEMEEKVRNTNTALERSDTEKKEQSKKIVQLKKDVEESKSAFLQLQQKTAHKEQQLSQVMRELAIEKQKLESCSKQHNAEILKYKSELKKIININEMLENDQEIAAKKISVLIESELNLQQSLNTRFEELAILTKILHENEKQYEANLAKINTDKELILPTPKKAITEKIKNKISTVKQNRIKARQLQKDVELIRNSNYFDHAWYIKQNPESLNHKFGAAGHYLENGVELGINPSPLFDGNWYLLTYQDVKVVGINPLFHYIKYGCKEGREIVPSNYSHMTIK